MLPGVCEELQPIQQAVMQLLYALQQLTPDSQNCLQYSGNIDYLDKAWKWSVEYLRHLPAASRTKTQRRACHQQAHITSG